MESVCSPPADAPGKPQARGGTPTDGYTATNFRTAVAKCQAHSSIIGPCRALGPYSAARPSRAGIRPIRRIALPPQLVHVAVADGRAHGDNILPLER